MLLYPSTWPSSRRATILIQSCSARCGMISPLTPRQRKYGSIPWKSRTLLIPTPYPKEMLEDPFWKEPSRLLTAASPSARWRASALRTAPLTWCRKITERMYLRIMTPLTMETVKQSIAKAKARNVISIRLTCQLVRCMIFMCRRILFP